MSNVRWAALGVLLVAVAGLGSGVYKWVDEQGRAHYADTPPAGGKAREIPIQPAPSKEQVDEGNNRARKLEQVLHQLQTSRSTPERAGTTQPTPASLGPLPPNARSQWLSTIATGIVYELKADPQFRFSMTVNAHSDLPEGTLLEAHFENPAKPAVDLVVEEPIRVQGGVKLLRVFFLTPPFPVIRCRDYQVQVHVYRNAEKKELLGIHKQWIQSRTDSDLLRSPDAILKAAEPRGLCP